MTDGLRISANKKLSIENILNHGCKIENSVKIFMFCATYMLLLKTMKWNETTTNLK